MAKVRVFPNRNEQSIIDKADEVLNNPEKHTLADLERADRAKRKQLRLAEERAEGKPQPDGKPDPEVQPDQEGWRPSAAQQRVLDELEEDGKTEEAEVWRLVYKMESA